MADLLWSPSPTAWLDAVPAASFSALANGSIAVGSPIDNAAGYEWCELSFVSAAAAIAVVAGGHLAVYHLPLLADISSYPNNSTTGANLPGLSYLVETIALPAGSIQPAGGVIFPVRRGNFKIGIANRTGVAFATSTSGHAAKYRLTNKVVV